MHGPPAGWHEDPWAPQNRRWWDGRAWTGYVVHPIVKVDSRPPLTTFPLTAALGGIAALALPLIGVRFLLQAISGAELPIFVLVLLNAIIGYGPSVWWCREVSRRWGSDRLRADLGVVARRSDAGWGPLTWASCFAAQALMAVIITVTNIPIISNTEGVDDLSGDRGYVIALLIVAVLVAPVVEEMLFRGVIQRGLQSVLPAWVAVGVQAVLFGSAHFDPIRGTGNIGLIMVLSAVGFVLGGAAQLFRRIVPGMIAHGILNAVALTIVLSGWTPDV